MLRNIVEEKGITFSASDMLDLDMELAQTTKSKESEKKKGERFIVYVMNAVAVAEPQVVVQLVLYGIWGGIANVMGLKNCRLL